MQRILLTSLLLGITAAHTTHAVPKDTVQVQSALDGSGSSVKETSAGDLLADALREAGNAQIGLVPADNIADTSIAPGSISPAQLTTLLRRPNDPGDTVVVLKLTGAQVLHALEIGLGHAPQPFAGFWQVSGLQVRYDASQPDGKRVSLAGVGGSEINVASTYTVAMTRSEALGDLGYFRVWGKKDITQDTGTSLSQSLLAYANAHKTLTVGGDARITAAH